MHTVLAEDSDSVFSTHIKQELRIASNSSLRGPTVLLWLPWAPVLTRASPTTHTHTHTYIIKNQICKKDITTIRKEGFQNESPS